jgi:D-3-phosphoglycerate dehydrogenase
VSYSHVLVVSYRSDRESRQVMGTVFGADDVRIVSIDGFHLEIKPQGNLILYSNIDRPGMLATVSAVLAQHQINIGWLSLGRFGQGEKALTAVSTDTAVNDDILRQISAIDGVSDARRLHL